MPNQETKVVCPVCGAEIALPEHSHITTGVVIGKDSNLGTITLPVSKLKPVESKLEALRNAGVDVSYIFSITDAEGISKLARIEDGKIQEMSDDDPVLARIVSEGTVPNRRLFRRWVMAQVFHMLADRDGFTKALQRKGYQYQWKMLIEELRVQAKLAVSDPENFEERNRWFNKDVAVKIAQDYIVALTDYVNGLPARRCRHRPYVHLRGRNVFKDSIEREVFRPLQDCLFAIKSSITQDSLYRNVKLFYYLIKRTWLSYNIPMSSAFKSAYKGAGAFFTMKNLILFHNCFIHSSSGKVLSKIISMKKLYDNAEEYSNEGWRLFGVMKKLITDNNIDIQAKMAEWRKK